MTEIPQRDWRPSQLGIYPGGFVTGHGIRPLAGPETSEWIPPGRRSRIATIGQSLPWRTDTPTAIVWLP